jgi:flagellar motility protein MotE (MotC chaperone)
MSESVQNDKKKINPILWILFAVIIPLIIVIVIIGIILGVAGFNVIDWAKEQGSEIPIVSNFITSEEETETEMLVERMTETLSGKDEEIDQLNVEISNLETHVADLENEIEEQQQMMEQTEETDADPELMSENDSLVEVAKTYEEMDSGNAATILELMEEDEVILILRELASDVRGEILEVMDSELAANLTQRLMNE